MSASDLPTPPKYIWEERYAAALLETDQQRLCGRIAWAVDSMSRRLIALKPKDSQYAKEEYEAIRDAQNLLRSLERVRK
jgi:hypothetical protein